jgi:hypothetical protein
MVVTSSLSRSEEDQVYRVAGRWGWKDFIAVRRTLRALRPDVILMQYTPEQYAQRVGWGHSAVADTVTFASVVRARHLVPFHHDPAHSDDDLDALFADIVGGVDGMRVTPAVEGETLVVGE